MALKIGGALLFSLLGFIAGELCTAVLATHAINSIKRTATQERERLTAIIKHTTDWPFLRSDDCVMSDGILVCQKIFRCPPQGGQCEEVPYTHTFTATPWGNPMEMHGNTWCAGVPSCPQ